MNLSISSAIMGRVASPRKMYTLRECLDALRGAGYDSVDLSFWQQGGRGMPLSQDNWREWAAENAEYMKSIGMSAYQCHGQTLSGLHWDEPDYPDREFIDEMIYRGIEAAAIFDVKWVVLHPSNLPHAPLYDRVRLRDSCVAHLAPYIEAAKKAGVGIAVENMVDFRNGKHRYCGGDIYELVELIEYINDPSVEICLDTGHANIGGADAAEAVRAIGRHLRCTHINDNNAKEDQHVMPYFGTVKWREVMLALREIGYEGDFAYEIGSRGLPDYSRDAWLKFTYEVGQGLLSIR